MPLSIDIVGIIPKNSGEEAELKILIYNRENPDRHEEIKLTVFSKMLFEIGNIGVNSLPYSLTREQYDTLTYDGELYGAVKKGMDILTYGDNTLRGLISKLRSRGFDKYIAEDAAEELKKAGYINESAYLADMVSRLGNVKLYGASRIRGELYKKGFSRELLSEELDELLSEIDFTENAYKLIKKKYDTERLSEPKYREAVYGAMYRYGYSPAQTKVGIKRLLNTDWKEP